MKRYRYTKIVEDGQLEIATVSEKDILEDHWEFWSRKMSEKYGADHEDITGENCITDWLSSHSMALHIPEDNE